ncbi:not available [Yersinia enterocolitica]|nr:not available [Yersinia enterocolitica]
MIIYFHQPLSPMINNKSLHEIKLKIHGLN